MRFDAREGERMKCDGNIHLGHWGVRCNVCGSFRNTKGRTVEFSYIRHLASDIPLERQRVIEEVTDKIKSHKARKFSGDLDIRIVLMGRGTTLAELERWSTATRQIAKRSSQPD